MLEVSKVKPTVKTPSPLEGGLKFQFSCKVSTYWQRTVSVPLSALAAGGRAKQSIPFIFLILSVATMGKPGGREWSALSLHLLSNAILPSACLLDNQSPRYM